jgi:hypothetical protein
MNSRRRNARAAAAAPGAETQESTNSADGNADPRELQGIVCGRHADQRPPRWDDPPESPAMRLLETSWPER